MADEKTMEQSIDKAVNHAVDQALIQSDIDSKDASASTTLLEQYKVYVDSMEKLIARRQGVHTFFSTVNSFLLMVAGLLLTKDFIGSRVAAVPLVLASSAGVALVIVWWKLSLYYSLLARAKFSVIHAYERHLPSAPFWAEWAAVDYGKNPQKYRSMTSIESIVPVVFGLCYLVVGIIGLLILFGLIHLPPH